MTNPYAKRWQRIGWLPRDGETWDAFYKRTARNDEVKEIFSELRARLSKVDGWKPEMATLVQECEYALRTSTETGSGGSSPSEKHNKLAPELVDRIVHDSGGENDAMVVLESVMLGVMLFYAPDVRHASEFLETMTAQVIKRMKP